MAQENLDLWVRLKDDATAGISRIQGAFKAVNTSLNNAADGSKTFAKGLAVAGTGIVALGTMALKAAADTEQTKIAFTTMLGSAQKAKVFMQDLANFALKTPFELKGLQQSSKQLLAYGSTQDNVLKQLKVLGDISAGVGQDKLPQLILAFGQTQAATKLTGNELRQFTEAGVPIIDALAQHFNVAKDAIADMVKDGAVKFKDVEAALTSLTVKGGKFNDLMAAQSDSLSGKISNVGDAWGQFLSGQGAFLIDWGKKLSEMLYMFITVTLPAWIEKIKEVSGWLMDHKSALVAVAIVVTSLLLPAIISIGAAFAAAAIPLLPWLAGGVIIAGLVAGVMELVKNWQVLKSWAESIWTAIYLKHKTTFDLIISVVKLSWDVISGVFRVGAALIQGQWGEAWQAVKDTVSRVWQDIQDVVKASINYIIGKINGFIKLVNKAISAAAGWAGASNSTIGEIPMLANGGIVRKPTLAMVGEAGPEAVVPLNKMSSMRGQGVSGVVINVYGDVTGEEAVQKLGDMLVRRLQVSSAIV